MFNWLAGVDALNDIALTARAQVVSPTDLPDNLLWPTFMPRQDVDSIRLADISAGADFRPTSDRREWGQRGRFIPLRTADISDIEMIPIEAYYKVGEREITLLMNRLDGNQQMFARRVGADIVTRTPGLAESNFRRIEKDTFDAWALGQITVRDPQGKAADEVVGLGIDPLRYPTALTAWNDNGVNAFDLLLAEYDIALEMMGAIGGIMLRTAALKEIQKDAPRPLLAPNVALTQAQLRDQVEQATGGQFQIIKNEQTLDVFTDGGITTVRGKVWPAGRVAFFPPGFVVGKVAFAPVVRAYEMVNGGGGLIDDVRGQTVYKEIAGNGRELTVECQVNALPIPDASKVYVINVGV